MKRSLWLAAIVPLIILSCRTPKELVYKDIENFKFQQAGLKQTIVSASVRMYNPNRFSLKLKKAEVEVFLNEKHLGNVVLDSLFAIPRLDSFSLPVSLAVDMAGLLPGALQMLMNSEVTLKLKGSVKAGKHGMYVSVPVDYEARQDVMALMK